MFPLRLGSGLLFPFPPQLCPSLSFPVSLVMSSCLTLSWIMWSQFYKYIVYFITDCITSTQNSTSHKPWQLPVLGQVGTGRTGQLEPSFLRDWNRKGWRSLWRTQLLKRDALQEPLIRVRPLETLLLCFVYLHVCVLRVLSSQGLRTVEILQLGGRRNRPHTSEWYLLQREGMNTLCRLCKTHEHPPPPPPRGNSLQPPEGGGIWDHVSAVDKEVSACESLLPIREKHNLKVSLTSGTFRHLVSGFQESKGRCSSDEEWRRTLLYQHRDNSFSISLHSWTSWLGNYVFTASLL